MRITHTLGKGSCNCHCNACDSGHHCGNPPNCNARR